jgi:hypothetical protein
MTGARFAHLIRRARLGGRLAALAVAATLVVSATPVSAHAGPANAQEIERLYLEGQDQFAANDFKGAADSWTRLLNLMPESGTNRATRENVLINILAAHLEAYRRMRNADGSRPIEHLREGKKTLDQYYSDFKQVHGDRTAVSAAVQQKGDELEQDLAKAEEEVANLPPTVDPEIEPIEPLPPEGGGGGGGGLPPDNAPRDLGPQSNGMGLIIGGSAIAGAGLISLVTMVPIGAIRGRQAEEDYETARDANDMNAMEVANRNGDKANAIAIAGGVVGGVLIAAGVVVLTLGIVKRKKAQERITSVSPVFDRNFAGFAVQGRF